MPVQGFTSLCSILWVNILLFFPALQNRSHWAAEAGYLIANSTNKWAAASVLTNACLLSFQTLQKKMHSEQRTVCFLGNRFTFLIIFLLALGLKLVCLALADTSLSGERWLERDLGRENESDRKHLLLGFCEEGVSEDLPQRAESYPRSPPLPHSHKRYFQGR